MMLLCDSVHANGLKQQRFRNNVIMFLEDVAVAVSLLTTNITTASCIAIS